MKLYYVVNARVPNEKAHAIQIAKMCEAFIEEGAEVTLIAPARRNTGQSLREFYGLRVSVPLVRLPVIDLYYRLGRFGFAVSSASFMASYTVYLWWKRLCGERFALYAVDMDTFSFALLPLSGPCFIEIHGRKPATFLNRLFFRRARAIATNGPIAADLEKKFPMSGSRRTIEPNGVDDAVLKNELSKQEARRRLNLPPDAPFALYAGRIYAWKGLEILADAAADSPLPLRIVGGTREEYERIVGASGARIDFRGVRPAGEMPLWIAAADALLVLGTARNEDSYLFTSPMKVFEYFAARRPVVASATPALKDMVPHEAVWWYEPDDASSLNAALAAAYTAGSEAEGKVQAGYEAA
ncbi:MAG: glycosyltransferase family 4 protein, partial [Candidatus Liptonbacteria bacterium]|nr:glycosyltransferase family 4 protein [Candidatus Liptonbacteria bacterium]